MNKALEDLQAGRDPFALAHEAESNHETFYYGAAKWCAALPVVAGVTVKVWTTISKGVEGPNARWLAVGAGGLFVLLLLAALVLGIIALCGTAKLGRQGLLGRSIWGIVASLILLTLFGAGVLRGVRDVATVRALTASSKRLQEDTKRDFERGDGVSPEKQELRVARLQAQMESASQLSSGNTALFAQSASAYLQRMQPIMREYSTATKQLQQPSVLDMRGVERREQLGAKKNSVKKFMTANDNLRNFVVNGEKICQEELERAQMPPEARATALKGFQQGFAKTKEVNLQIREDDQRMGVAMLGMLELLDSNWGKWRYNTARAKVVFDDDAVLDKYVTYREELETAAREQVKLQAKLVNVPEN